MGKILLLPSKLNIHQLYPLNLDRAIVAKLAQGRSPATESPH
ncbi:hypothetical protein [Microcoleus sp. herbarium19]